jgi:hypothetical protein
VSIIRVCVVALLAAGPAAAAEKVKDEYWGFELQIDGLKPLLNLAAPARVYYGRTRTLHVSVFVHELATARTGEEWRKDREEAVRHRKGISDVTADKHRLLYRRKTLAGLVEQHGHGFFSRGLQCLELHVVGGEGATGIRAALDRLRMREKAPGALLVFRVARETGRARDDPQVLLDAGIDYVTGKTFRIVIPEMGARVLALARSRLEEKTYTPERLWLLYEYGGMAHTARPLEAFEWHRLAEEAAKRTSNGPERARQSAYNAACAASRANRLDDAFAALDRAFSGGKPVSDAHVSDDKDLTNCRKDPRWEAFWRNRVKGQ